MADDLAKLVREHESGKPVALVSWQRKVPPAKKPAAAKQPAKPRPAGKPRLEKLKKLPAPFADGWETTAVVGSMLVLGKMEPRALAFVDVSVWPPAFTIERGFYPFAIRGHGERWAAAGHTAKARYRAWLFGVNRHGELRSILLTPLL